VNTAEIALAVLGLLTVIGWYLFAVQLNLKAVCGKELPIEKLQTLVSPGTYRAVRFPVRIPALILTIVFGGIAVSLFGWVVGVLIAAGLFLLPIIVLGRVAQAQAALILRTAQANLKKGLARLNGEMYAIVSKGAREGKTINTERALRHVLELRETYQGPDREAYVQTIDRIVHEFREKYGPEIPADEAYRLMRELEQKTKPT